MLQVGRQLPGGSFASIHEGRDVDDETGHERRVVIKRLRPDECLATLTPASKENGARVISYCHEAFERERRLWVRLAPHPAIVHALRAERIDGKPALVLEFVEGASLQEMLCHQDAGPLPLLDVLDLLRQLSTALAYLHDRAGIAHGDVLPQNVLYDGFGRVMIADFGLAVELSSPPARAPLALYFEPPEELQGPPTPAGDMWRLGVTMAAALLGRQISPAEARKVGLAERAVEHAFVDVGPAERRLRTPFRDLLRSLLARSPRSRPADGHNLHRMLRDSSGALGKAFQRLVDRDHLRADARWLGRRGASARELRRLGEQLRAVEAPGNGVMRLMPETPRCLAEAAWSAFSRTRRPELRELAEVWAARAEAAYPDDRGVQTLLRTIRRSTGVKDDEP